MPCLRSCLMWCLLVTGLVAVESPAPVPSSPPGTDLREALAGTTRERDELILQVDRLENQRSLLIAVAGLLTVAVGLLVRSRLLVRRRKAGAAAEAEQVEIDESEPFPEAPGELVTATTVTMRKNATITIRNGSTQREEVTGQVQTRRFFSSGETRRTTRRESATGEPRREDETPPATPVTATTERATRAVNRRATHGTPTPVQLSATEVADNELKPSTDRVPRTATDPGASQTDGPRRPVTVRVDHQSDRMDVVEVTVKPGTTGIFRRQGFTVLEVMISIALLATVLSSVVASTYTLHRSRQLAKEDAESQMLGRLFVERIMAEWHWNLHSPLAGSLWKANYADDASAVPLTAQMLKDSNIIEELPALDDLKVYLEYYPEWAMENAINTRQPMDLSNRQGWMDRTVVMRIVIEWTSSQGDRRRHVQLFARTHNE